MWELANKTDDEIIIAMCRELNREDPGPNPVPDDHMRNTLRILREEPIRGRTVVLRLDGQVRGYALLISFWSNELGGEACNIDELYVHSEYRNRGHARSLFRALVARELIWPGRSVALELEVTPHNTRAKAFYRSLGFQTAANSAMRLPILKN